MKKRRVLLMLASTASLPIAAVAPTVRAAPTHTSTHHVSSYRYTLQQALIQAYRTNPQLLKERATLRQTDEGVSQAHSGWRPTISANAAMEYGESNSGYNAHLGNTLLREHTIFSSPGYGVGVNVSQPIFQGGKTVATTRQAIQKVKAERAQLTNVEQQVFLNVVQAYVDLQRTKQLLDLNRDNELTLERQAKLADQQFHYSQNTLTDVLQAKSQYKSAEADTKQAEADYTIAKSQFKKVVGVLPPADLVAPAPMPLSIKNEQEAEMLAVEQNPNLIGAKHAVEAQKAGLKVAFAALLPTITMQGSYNHGPNQNYSKSDQDYKQVMVQANLPIYQNGSEYSQIRAARQGISAAVHELDNQKRTVIQGAVSAWQKYLADQEKYLDNKTSVLLGQEAFRSIQQQELLGVRTMFEVLQQQQILFQQQRTLVQNHADLVLDSYALAAQLGRLTVEGLKLKTPVYNSKAYYNRVKWKIIGTE